MSASDFEAMLAAEFEASLPENSLYRCAYGASDWGPTNNFFDFVLGKLAAARPIVEAVDTAHNTASMPCPLWCADSPCRIFDGSVYKCGPYQCSIGGAQHT